MSGENERQRRLNQSPNLVHHQLVIFSLWVENTAICTPDYATARSDRHTPTIHWKWLIFSGCMVFFGE
uniref:hypothetical protein n=1 Tax=Gluconobacter thailandicus TaxID=257438 RepID=UPI0012E7FF70|nr:hypothetical protein [Gluconobacter thailandicus]